MKTSGRTLERRIHRIRGKRVMLDSDLAEIYGVPTKRLNEQVRRNFGRFPDDFMFQLTRKEAVGVAGSRSQIATLKRAPVGLTLALHYRRRLGGFQGHRTCWGCGYMERLDGWQAA